MVVSNNGQEIVSTDFWESKWNDNGMLYLSVNAGAFRLLVPDNCRDFDLNEVNTAKVIVISTGKGMGRECVFEILYDDYTNSPYSMHFGTEQSDRIPTESKGEFRFIIYKKGMEKVLDTKCYYRKVNKIPCLKPLGMA